MQGDSRIRSTHILKVNRLAFSRLLICLMLLLPLSVQSDEPAPLPELGDPAGGLISPDQEFRMGRAWLRQLHAQVPLLNDPLVQEYVEHLVYRLASHSDLKEPDLPSLSSTVVTSMPLPFPVASSD